MDTVKQKKDIFYLLNKYSECFPRAEIEALLSRIFACSRTALYTDDILADDKTERLCDSMMERRASGEPLQYITGSAEFMGSDFNVNNSVLIPRPETEILVREVLASAMPGSKILDMCAGSGNIAVSLAKAMPSLNVTAVDISGAAIETARANCVYHCGSEKVRFYKSDLFDALPLDKKYKFDIIVCNPPYVKSADMDFLQKEVTREPRIALDGGADGLDFYRRIAQRAGDYLAPKGSIALEAGIGQAENIKAIFEVNNIFNVSRIIKDFAGIDRVLWIDLL
ncbi:MAG: peptide chain release factor N(5)-glutamine methyltransferase [Candidatus Omnitrophica bacterium]|nr:peptide chain release factor N(5)-glutamine methyltransferase [Candidatus Omnitrophota bacterium]